jgi:hypothetical protein
MMRKLLWATLVIGIALAVAPFAIGLPGKAAAGQRMLNGFRPIMQPGQVQVTANYYDHVFVPLGTVAPMMSAQNVARFQGYLNGFGNLNLDRATQVQMAPMQRDFTALLGTMQRNTGIFARVPAGLRHYRPLVRTMQANVDNYRQVDSLPDFRLFTWFFVVPGVLLVLLAGYGLLGTPVARRETLHHRPTATAA